MPPVDIAPPAFVAKYRRCVAPAATSTPPVALIPPPVVPSVPPAADAPPFVEMDSACAVCAAIRRCDHGRRALRSCRCSPPSTGCSCQPDSAPRTVAACRDWRVSRSVRPVPSASTTWPDNCAGQLQSSGWAGSRATYVPWVRNARGTPSTNGGATARRSPFDEWPRVGGWRHAGHDGWPGSMQPAACFWPRVATQRRYCHKRGGAMSDGWHCIEVEA